MQERDQAISTRRPPAGVGLGAAQGQRLGGSSGANVNSGANASRAAAVAGQGDFGQALAQAGTRPSLAVRTVAAGDTLTSLVKDHAEAQGLALSNSHAHRWAQQVAIDNKISNVNRIFPGQQIALGAIPAELASALASASAPSSAPIAAGAVAAAPVSAAPVTAAALVARAQPASGIAPAPARHDVLDRTLDRAVAKGFIPPNERGDVRDKILALASEHRFNPDDFARMTLMESDGMNPRATNQRCHGIIQFCGGPDRGAASAGYAANPKAILGLSVYQQLHLVDKYFDDVGLKNKGPAGLDDLYLSVLMPSARVETRTDAPLNVNGAQARYLYEGRDSRAPITRQSILQGLLQNAAERLGPAPASTAPLAPAAKGRLQAMRTAAYENPSPNLPALPNERPSTQLR